MGRLRPAGESPRKSPARPRPDPGRDRLPTYHVGMNPGPAEMQSAGEPTPGSPVSGGPMSPGSPIQTAPDSPPSAPTAPIWRLVLALALPALAQQYLHLLVRLSDQYLADHFELDDPGQRAVYLSALT